MSENIVNSILGWLRAGYPEGVPPKDYTPLLALLRRTLSNAEFDEIVARLELEPDPIVESDIRAAIAEVTEQPVDENAVEQVAARLAAAGWPLSGDLHARIADSTAESAADSTAEAGAREHTDTESPSLVARILGWLRAGYPEGVPSTDYVPLLALLRRRITDEEVTEVAEALVSEVGPDGEVSQVEARVLMTKVLNELPSEEDVQRVADHLQDSGIELV